MQGMRAKFQFLLIGSVAFVVDITVYLFLTELISLHYLLARVIAFLIAVGVTCVGNRTFTFSTRIKTPLLFLYSKAILAAVFSFIPNVLVFWSALVVLPSGIFSSMSAFVLGTVVGVTLNFILSDKYVFSSEKVYGKNKLSNRNN